MRLPLFIIYAIVALNLTMFTLMLQFDLLIFKSAVAKVVAWAFTVGAWWLTYANRNKFITLFEKK